MIEQKGTERKNRNPGTSLEGASRSTASMTTTLEAAHHGLSIPSEQRKRCGPLIITPGMFFVKT